nr:hypothetical protein [Holdemania massiliensis]
MENLSVDDDVGRQCCRNEILFQIGKLERPGGIMGQNRQISCRL